MSDKSDKPDKDDLPVFPHISSRRWHDLLRDRMEVTSLSDHLLSTSRAQRRPRSGLVALLHETRVQRHAFRSRSAESHFNLRLANTATMEHMRLLDQVATELCDSQYSSNRDPEGYIFGEARGVRFPAQMINSFIRALTEAQMSFHLQAHISCSSLPYTRHTLFVPSMSGPVHFFLNDFWTPYHGDIRDYLLYPKLQPGETQEEYASFICGNLAMLKPLEIIPVLPNLDYIPELWEDGNMPSDMIDPEFEGSLYEFLGIDLADTQKQKKASKEDPYADRSK